MRITARSNKYDMEGIPLALVAERSPMLELLFIGNIECRGFKQFIKTAAPHYKPPSRRTLTRNVDVKYETLKVKAELVKVKSLCLTSDTRT